MAAPALNWVQVEVTCVEDLQAVIREYPPESLVRIGVSVSNLSEAIEMQRRLGFALQNPGWTPRYGTLEMLEKAKCHLINLEALKIASGFLIEDLVDLKPLKKNIFSWLSQTANEAVTEVHPSRALPLLQSVTIEAQMIGRSCRALGFGSPEVEPHVMTTDELAWLQDEGMIDIGDSDEQMALIRQRILLKLQNLHATIDLASISSYMA